MEEIVKLNLELDICAQKIIQQIKFHNENIENLIAKGLEKAINDLSSSDESFINYVAETTKKELDKIIKNILTDWTLQNKIRDKFQNIIENKVEDIADDLLKKLIN